MCPTNTMEIHFSRGSGLAASYSRFIFDCYQQQFLQGVQSMALMKWKITIFTLLKTIWIELGDILEVNTSLYYVSMILFRTQNVLVFFSFHHHIYTGHVLRQYIFKVYRPVLHFSSWKQDLCTVYMIVWLVHV